MGNKHNRKSTKTSPFGVSGRISHDSTAFYTSKLYDDLPKEQKVTYTENPIPSQLLNNILNKSSEAMDELPDNSVHLMVTSPPYNVGKQYDKNLTLKKYREFLKSVWFEVHRVIVPGGRVCINVANLGRKPYIPIHTYITEDMVEIGFLMRGELIWNKSSSASPSTAWGSWMSSSNPTLRDIHEYVLVFSKSSFARKNPQKRNSTISREEFLEYTKSVWTFPAESAKKIGHPAPYPIELPYRCIQLYTFENEIVLDPFIGSGQTAIAALKANRKYIGYDIDKSYCLLAEKRIQEYALADSTIDLFETNK